MAGANLLERVPRLFFVETPENPLRGSLPRRIRERNESLRIRPLKIDRSKTDRWKDSENNGDSESVRQVLLVRV